MPSIIKMSNPRRLTSSSLQAPIISTDKFVVTNINNYGARLELDDSCSESYRITLPTLHTSTSAQLIQMDSNGQVSFTTSPSSLASADNSFTIILQNAPSQIELTLPNDFTANQVLGINSGGTNLDWLTNVHYQNTSLTLDNTTNIVTLIQTDQANVETKQEVDLSHLANTLKSPDNSFNISVANLASGGPTTLTIPSNYGADNYLKIDTNGTALEWGSQTDIRVPTGSILQFGGTSAPTGFLMCNGDAVSRTTYANLFSVVGINFGQGDGSTTFNVPDCRGRFIRGVDGGVGRDPDRASRTGGDTVGSTQGDEIRSHLHQYNEESRSGTQDVDDPDVLDLFSGNVNVNTGSFTHTRSTANTGGNETRPINIALNSIIKF